MSTLRRHKSRLSAAAVVALVFFAIALGCRLTTACIIKGKEKTHNLRGAENQRADRWVAPARRRLIGPGSSPPTCRSRCGRCAPCRPVHVVILPGRGVPMEYYPEAWRCKCGNKHFMP